MKAEWPLAPSSEGVDSGATATQSELVEATRELNAAASALREVADRERKNITGLRDAFDAFRLRKVPSPMWLVLSALVLVAGAATAGFLLSHRGKLATSRTAGSTTSTTASPVTSTPVSLPVRLTAVDLRGAHFVNVDLSGVDLSSACLMNARFEGVVLTGTRLAGADLRGAEFIGSDPGQATGTFVVDGRTRFGLDKVPANALLYDGKQSLPCDANRA